MIEITEAGCQLAADLANAEAERLGYKTSWCADDFNNSRSSLLLTLARLATQSIADKTHTEAIEAQLAEAKADLREIWGKSNDGLPVRHTIDDIRAIAAKHRVETDPLVEALQGIVPKIDCADGETPAEAVARLLRAELAKRGIELAVKS